MFGLMWILHLHARLAPQRDFTCIPPRFRLSTTRPIYALFKDPGTSIVSYPAGRDQRTRPPFHYIAGREPLGCFSARPCVNCS